MAEPQAVSFGSVSDLFSENTILNSLPQGVLLVNNEGYILFANPAAEELLNSPVSRLKGAAVEDVFRQHSEVLEAVKAVLKRHISVFEPDIELLLFNGAKKNVDMEFSPLTESETPFVIIQIHGEGLASALKRSFQSEEHLRQGAAMSAVLAHEVKNPLAGIRGAAQLLETGIEEKDKRLTSLIMRECDRIRTLIDRMDALANPVPQKKPRQNIHEILDEAAQSVISRSDNELAVKTAYDPSLPDVAGDKALLVQIFINLLQNASEAMDGKGNVTMRTSYRHDARVMTEKGPLSLPIEVRIEDEGPGIDEKIMPHLFDPFVTGRSGGHGLGLALVEKFVHDHGGTVVASNSERGAVFTIRFPVMREGSDG